jgi:hypothetical protein
MKFFAALGRTLFACESVLIYMKVNIEQKVVV